MRRRIEEEEEEEEEEDENDEKHEYQSCRMLMARVTSDEQVQILPLTQSRPSMPPRCTFSPNSSSRFSMSKMNRYPFC